MRHVTVETAARIYGEDAVRESIRVDGIVVDEAEDRRVGPFAIVRVTRLLSTGVLVLSPFGATVEPQSSHITRWREWRFGRRVLRRVRYVPRDVLESEGA